jgi:uncharacterized protein (DUF58 family)
VTRHLTVRFAVCAVGSVAGVTGAVSGVPELLVLALPLFWAVVFSLADGWWPYPDDLDYLVLTKRVVEGDEVEIEIHINTTCSLPWLEAELELDDGLTPTAGTHRIERHRLHVDGQHFVIPLTFLAATWGVRGPRAIRIASQDRLGMTRCETRISFTDPVVVHPQTVRLDQLLTLTKTRQMTGEHRSRQRGQGTELAEVRPARPGDLAAAIHPRLTARRGSPMVLERHPEQASEVVLLIDAAQDIGVDLDTTLRWTVQAALAVNERHQRGMDRVGVIDWGGTIRWLDPALGRRSAQLVARSLLETTVARRSDTGTTSGLPLARLPKRCVVLAISPGTSPALNRDLLRIRRRGHQVIVVQPQLPEHVGPGLPARIGRVLAETRRRTLTSSGVLVVRWNPEEPLGRVLTALDRHRSRATIRSRG